MSIRSSGGGVTDHGLLTGLADDDHTQYTTTAEATTIADSAVATHDALVTAHRHITSVAFWSSTSSSTVLTNAPAGDTEIEAASGRCRRQADLRIYTRARIHAKQDVAGAAGMLLKLQRFDGAAFVDSGIQIAAAAVGENVGSWISIPAAMQIESQRMRIVGSGGDGVADPAWQWISVEFDNGA